MIELNDEDKARLIAGLYKSAFPQYATDLPDILCTGFDEALHSGNEQYIRGVLASIGFSILDGNPVDPSYREFVGNALIEIGHGNVDANKAFHLKTGHRKKTSKAKEGRITLLVLSQIYIGKKTADSAFKTIGNRKDVALSWERVRDIYTARVDEVVKQIIDLPKE